ncbi:MAG: hypothetical protein GKR95_12830 [Gammaproteobacteria bacterium]|nr:hypothetical protein [Gammaproteobacteria bacterium]
MQITIKSGAMDPGWLRTLIFSWLILGIMVFHPAHARTIRIKFSIAEALQGQQGYNDIPVYFGNQTYPEALGKIENRGFTIRGSTPRKPKASAATGLTRNEAQKQYDMVLKTLCDSLFVQVHEELKQYANNIGASGVVRVISNFKNVFYTSETQYECVRGRNRTAVNLQGDFVSFVDDNNSVNNPASPRKADDENLIVSPAKSYRNITVELAPRVRAQWEKVDVYEEMNLEYGILTAMQYAGMISTSSQRNIKVEIERLRVRSDANAFFTGMLSGSDHIVAWVSVETQGGQNVKKRIVSKTVLHHGDRLERIRQHFVNAVLMFAN